jgi:hypothetical protein
VDWDGRNKEKILEANEPDLGPMLLLDVSEGRNLGLIFYHLAFSVFLAQENSCYLRLVDLDTAEVKPLKEATGDGFEFTSVGNATLSPDGSKVAYVYEDPDMNSVLAVRDVDGEEEQILLRRDGWELTGRLDYGLSLDWAEDDTLYVWTGHDSGLLLKLGTE